MSSAHAIVWTCIALSCVALSFAALPLLWLVSPFLFLFYLSLSCPALFRLVLYLFALPCLVLSFLVLYFLVLSCVVLTCLTSPCLQPSSIRDFTGPSVSVPRLPQQLIEWQSSLHYVVILCRFRSSLSPWNCVLEQRHRAAPSSGVLIIGKHNNDECLI